jgi:hypothetical protein
MLARGAAKLRQVFIVDQRTRVGGQLVARVVSEQLSELGLDDHLFGLEVPLPDADLPRDARELESARRFNQRQPVPAPADRLNQERHDQRELDRDEHQQRDDPALIELPSRRGRKLHLGPRGQTRLVELPAAQRARVDDVRSAQVVHGAGILAAQRTQGLARHLGADLLGMNHVAAYDPAADEGVLDAIDGGVRASREPLRHFV